MSDPATIPWELTPLQQELLARTADFGRREIEPVADAADRQGCIPDGLAQRFHDAGLATTFLEAKPGDDFVTTACLMTEQLAYHCVALASYLMLPVFFNRVVISQLGGAEREQFLARCQTGPVITAFAASEAAAGSDLMALQLEARRTNGDFVLTGRKEYSSNLAAADYVIVVARTAEGDARFSGAMSWLLLATDAPGVEVGPRWPTFGLRAIDVSPLNLAAVRVPADRLLGEQGRGLAMMGSSLVTSRSGIAALGVGVSRRMRDLLVEHSKGRRIYGAKLNRMQDYRFRIADIEKNIAAARALVWIAAQRADRGEDAVKESSIAKLFSGEMAMNTASAASAMLGSIGYTGQSPIEKLLRDARHVAIVEGPEPTHKELIFGHLLRHGGY
jgi:alkylation response protein AidB-like acyl-CoA dehydrogenase